MFAATVAAVVVSAGLAVVGAKDRDHDKGKDHKARHNTALGFSPYQYAGGAGIAQGAAVPLLDNVRMSAWIKWAGPTYAMFGQTAVYNGNSACSGFGIWVNNDGTVSLLLGGVTWLSTDGSIAANEWHQVEVTRINGTFAIEIDEIPHTVAGNTTAPQPFGYGGWCNQEALIVGNGSVPVFVPGSFGQDAFNGAIDDVRVKSVGRSGKINLFWRFNEGVGAIARDIHGVLLSLADTTWVAGHAGDEDDDN